MFTKIVVTMDRYKDDQNSGALVDTKKLKGTVKDVQTIVAVGSNSAGLSPGDMVVINPTRYAVMKHNEGSLKNGVIEDNPVIGYNFPVIELNGVDHMLLDTQDIDYVIEEYEDDTKKSDLYTPPSKLIV